MGAATAGFGAPSQIHLEADEPALFLVAGDGAAQPHPVDDAGALDVGEHGGFAGLDHDEGHALGAAVLTGRPRPSRRWGSRG